MDFDHGFSSGFSPPDYFRPFSVFGEAHKVPKSVTKSVFFLRKTGDKKIGHRIRRKIRSLLAEKSIATSVTITTEKILRNSGMLWTWENCPKSESSRKWLGEGAKGLLDPASKRGLLHWCKMRLHRVKRGFGWCKRLLGDLCSLGPKGVRKTFCTLIHHIITLF